MYKERIVYRSKKIEKLKKVEKLLIEKGYEAKTVIYRYKDINSTYTDEPVKGEVRIRGGKESLESIKKEVI